LYEPPYLHRALSLVTDPPYREQVKIQASDKTNFPPVALSLQEGKLMSVHIVQIDSEPTREDGVRKRKMELNIGPIPC
jgi:hypothetical protein